MRPRVLFALVLTLLIAPDAGFGTPIDLCELDAQEVVKRAKSVAVLYASPSAEADSIGFLGQNAQVTVKGCALGWCEVESALAKGFVLDSLLVAVPATVPSANPAPAPRPDSTRPAPRRTCCRVCTTGKACGNSCIARNRTCRQPAGCACNGGGPATDRGDSGPNPNRLDERPAGSGR